MICHTSYMATTTHTGILPNKPTNLTPESVLEFFRLHGVSPLHCLLPLPDEITWHFIYVGDQSHWEPWPFCCAAGLPSICGNWLDHRWPFILELISRSFPIRYSDIPNCGKLLSLILHWNSLRSLLQLNLNGSYSRTTTLLITSIFILNGHIRGDWRPEADKSAQDQVEEPVADAKRLGILLLFLHYWFWIRGKKKIEGWYMNKRTGWMYDDSILKKWGSLWFEWQHLFLFWFKRGLISWTNSVEKSKRGSLQEYKD